MGVLYTLCTGALLLAFQNPIMHLFTSDETVVSFGCIAMHYFCPFYFLLSILHGMAGAVRGTGRSVPPMVVLLVSLCLFRVVWIQFVLPFFSGIEGVFVLYPVSWALGAVLMVLYLSLIHISEPTRRTPISYAVFCLKKKKNKPRRISYAVLRVKTTLFKSYL